MLAFLPSVSSLLKGVFEDRTITSGVEFVLKHKISDGSSVLHFEERLVKEGNQISCLWKGFPQPVGAVIKKNSYVFSREKSIESRSLALRGYLLFVSPESYQSQLIEEQFLRKEHLFQFKSDFEPEGDPRTWGIAHHYLIHDDIFLERLSQGIAVAVVGRQEDSFRRAIYFDKQLRGILRIEWKDSDAWVTVNVLEFTKTAWGTYPQRWVMQFSSGGEVETEVADVRFLKEKQLSEFKNSFHTALRNPSSAVSADNFLRLLLSYR